MKSLIALLFLIFITLNIFCISAQDVIEIPFTPLAQDFIELSKNLEEIDETDEQQSIDLCITALEKFTEPNVRFNLIFWELSFHYANLKQYDKCLEILKMGQEEGLFYFTRTDSRPFPSYLKELESLEDYKSFVEQNQILKESAKKTSKTEFMVRLPDGYNENNKYPRFLVMHGGIGNIPNLQEAYNTKKLKKDFIIAFFQGSAKAGSYTRSFSSDWQERISEGFEQIISKYPVDTNNIILAGQSAGGSRSLILGLNHIIPAKGLLLPFPVAPAEIDSIAYIKSAGRGLKVALLCCENDWAIKPQKKLGYLLDKYEINNKFVVFPDKGHEFPDNWSYHLDTSIDFILKEN